MQGAEAQFLLHAAAGQQAEAEVGNGLLIGLQVGFDWPGRTIGLTYRSGWVPTKAQASLLAHIRRISGDAAAQRLHPAK